jgi:hypothetical protein
MILGLYGKQQWSRAGAKFAVSHIMSSPTVEKNELLMFQLFCWERINCRVATVCSAQDSWSFA